MAYVNSSHFESLRFYDPRAQKFGNWWLLNNWQSLFVDRMHNRRRGSWWGSVSEEQITTVLNRPDVRVGAIAIAEYFGDMFGGVCSGMVKADESTIIRFGVYIKRGRYRCSGFVQGDYSNPIEMMEDLVEEISDVVEGAGYLMARPRDIPDDPAPNGFSVARVVGEMRDMMQCLKGAWWGLSPGRSPGSPEHAAVIQDLQDLKGDYPNPAAAICYMDEYELDGYLFEIVTTEKTYKVTFDKSGYQLGTNNSLRHELVRFSTIRGLLDHMETVVNFVEARPLLTLKESCKRRIVEDNMKLDVLPTPLQDFILGPKPGLKKLPAHN